MRQSRTSGLGLSLESVGFFQKFFEGAGSFARPGGRGGNQAGGNAGRVGAQYHRRPPGFLPGVGGLRALLADTDHGRIPTTSSPTGSHPRVLQTRHLLNPLIRRWNTGPPRITAIMERPLLPADIELGAIPACTA